MARASLKQPSFAGGVISPQALGRTDQQKYAVGMRTCQNAWVTRYGTIENRPGSAFTGSVKDPTTTVRIIPFISFLGASYLLEFGNSAGVGYMRPWKNGSLISVVGSPAWSNVTAYVVGDLVTYLGNVYWCAVGNTNVLPTAPTNNWYLQSAGVLEVLTSIPAAALSSFQYVQQNDILTLASQLFRPGQLLHYSDTRWAFQAFALSTGIAAPATVSAVAGSPTTPPTTPTASAAGGVSNGTGFNPDAYKIVAFTATGTSVSSGQFISSGGTDYVASGGFPITITWGAIGGAVGYAIYKSPSSSGTFGLLAIVESATTYNDDGSITPANAIAQAPTGAGGATIFTYVVTAISAATGAESLASASAVCTGATPSVGAPNVISWATVTGASTYNIYRIVNGVPGFIGQQPASPFKDINIAPDTSKQPPSSLSLFATSSDWPAVVAYYQQRLCFANTINAPSSVWMSRVGVYSAFSVSTPVLANDAISFTLAGKQVQPVQAIVDLGKMIVHTSNAEYVVTGDASGVITPTSVGVTNTGSAGSALISPVIIGNTDLFVQAGATRLNDLRYEVQRFTFAGKDLTKFATDLFRGRTIVSMDWQKLPHSIVWCVLDNGALVGLTYVSEDELYAWHAHSTSVGFFEQVAVVLEGTQFALYVVVRRTINGATVRYIERFAARDCLDSVLFTDSVFLDASLTYDGRNTGSTTATVTTGAGWTPTDLLTITMSTSQFTSGDVGNRIVLQQKDATTGLVTDQVSLDILTYVSGTVVRAQAERAVPTWAQALALKTWGKAVKTFAGIGHLNGQSIGVLADGAVIADPLAVTRQPDGTTRPTFPAITVAAGGFTLTKPAMVVTAGLPVQVDLQTLPIENAQGETLANKRITVRECTPVFYASRGGFFGQDSAHLNEWKPPAPTTYGYPPAPYTGPARVPIQGTPQTTGQVWIRHTEPTPFGLSAVVVTGEIGD